MFRGHNTDTRDLLYIVMDNCCGQNKNNMVMRFGMYLVEMNIYKKVEFIFGIPGHTKNICDSIFGVMKKQYHKSVIYTMDQLRINLNYSDDIICTIVDHTDFFEWENFEDTIYNNLTGVLQNNYYFMIDCSSPTTLNISCVAHIDMSSLDIEISNAITHVPPIGNSYKYNSIDLMKKVNVLEKFN